MIVDSQTLIDLEILPERSGCPSILQMLDKAKTQGGRDRLKALLRAPKGSVGEIVETQKTLAFLATNVKLVETRISNSFMHGLEHYLRINIIPVRRRNWLFVALDSIVYRRHYGELQIGVNSAVAFIFELKSLADRVEALSLPKGFARHISAIQDFLGNADIQDLLTTGQSRALQGTDVFFYDNVFRNLLSTDLRALVQTFYAIDALRSMAIVNDELGYVFPQFTDGSKACLEIRGVVHPMLPNAVKNDIVFKEKHNFMFLTGPNMSGKTTLMKSCGIAVFLAHMGMGVPAQSMKLALFDRLFSSIDIGDNICLGYSYFYAEVKRVKEVAVALSNGERVFAFFDELFRGTNVKDAMDCSKAVMSGFSKKRGSLFVLSTHLLETVRDAEMCETVFFKYFDACIDNGSPTYSYELKDGASEQRLGRLILENEGIFQLLG